MPCHHCTESPDQLLCCTKPVADPGALQAKTSLLWAAMAAVHEEQRRTVLRALCTAALKLCTSLPPCSSCTAPAQLPVRSSSTLVHIAWEVPVLQTLGVVMCGKKTSEI